MRSTTAMRFRALAVLVTPFLVAGTAGAVVPRATPRISADTLTAMPAAGLAKPLRGQRDVRWAHPSTAAWRKLAGTGTWQAAWDRATGVPSRIWGSGLPAPGATASADIAAAVARATLAEHIALLAPGSTPADFVLVSNHFDGDIRSVGFRQLHGGRVVVGGQVSFRFKNDRLFVIGSEALPEIRLPAVTRASVSRVVLYAQATSALRRDLALPDARVTAPGDEVVLPLVGDDAVLGYRIAVPVTIDGGVDGRFLAYSDVATGETLAVRQLNLYTTGTVLYRSVDRFPGRPRIDRPAPRAHVMVEGVEQTTSVGGQVSWATTAPQAVVTSVVGDLVAIVNRGAGGMRASSLMTLAPDAQIVWDASAVPEDDAQIQTYLATNIAKDYASHLDPAMTRLNAQLVANVNIAQSCNAFYDGRDINFFRASNECQNTGLLHDVVFHEFGHFVHDQEVIDGVGAVDSAMGEGVADFFAAQITNDPGMGRGFFNLDGDTPLRNLDPPTTENRWPQDIGEIHKTGLIFAGTFWDLRKALIAQLGETEGIALTERLYLGTIRRSINIPTSLLEALATDDDDGNLANGTPHECAIRDAYGRHGLRAASGLIVAPDRVSDPATTMATVRIQVTGLSARCAGDELASARLYYKPASKTGAATTFVAATQLSPTEFSAELPLETDNKVLYQARVVFKDTSVLLLPDNLGDPYYELYQGKTVPLYCVDFDGGDPLAAGWMTKASGGGTPWTWGVPSGTGATDPRTAFTGSRVISQVLGGDYQPMSTSSIKIPPVDIGQWSDVRLQYRRWLAVEDSHFDQARIRVGDKQAWINATQNMGDASASHSIDREWRFHDVSLSGYQPGHTIDVSWELTSDEGLEFGGWTLDDVCVVANVNGVCGDGVVTVHEACDDGAGNGEKPNACRSWCQVPMCGDGIVDDSEQCDVGPQGDAKCTMSCRLFEEPDLGGCCSARGGAGGARGAGGAGVLAGLTLAIVLRRRRRR
jgi:hypothetical protein